MMEWQQQQQQQIQNQQQIIHHLQNPEDGIGNGNGGLYVKVMTDEQMELLRRQIAVYATICEQLVEMHKAVTAQQDLTGLSLSLSLFWVCFFLLFVGTTQLSLFLNCYCHGWSIINVPVGVILFHEIWWYFFCANLGFMLFALLFHFLLLFGNSVKHMTIMYLVFCSLNFIK